MALTYRKLSRSLENRPWPLRPPAEVGLLLAAERGELAQQLGLLAVELGGHDDVDVHHAGRLAVDAAVGAQPRHALAAQRAHGARLGARLDVQLLGPDSVGSGSVAPSAAAVIGS